MEELTFWKTVTVDKADLLDRLIAELAEHEIDYCVVGGQAVNAYVEPAVSLDLDLAITTTDIARIEVVLAPDLKVERFAHRINVSKKGSDLRVQFQTDPRYASFPERSEIREVLGLELPLARLEDVLDGKVWAGSDTTQRPSKRQKDLADISRILERYPELGEWVPEELLQRLRQGAEVVGPDSQHGHSLGGGAAAKVSTFVPVVVDRRQRVERRHLVTEVHHRGA